MRNLTVLAAMLSGCSAIEIGAELPALALEDVNVNSASFGQVVAVDDFDGQVSLWYFGHAT